MNLCISYGTYYSYLKPKSKKDLRNNIEAQVIKFNDGEVAVEFPDSIRGKHVFIFGDTVFYLVELLMTIDAAVRSSASEITVVLPYFGFARQDKKGAGRASIGSSVIARQLEALGVNRVLSIDLHAEQIMGNFKIPFEHITGKHLFSDLITHIITLSDPTEKWILCSPDAGGTTRVQKFAAMLGLPYVIMSKVRDKPGSVESMTLIGDVQGKNVIIIDDIVDTGGTLIKGNQYLMQMGAKSTKNIITHPVLSNNAIQKLEDAGIELITSDTRNKIIGNKQPQNFIIQGCADILHQAIYNIAEDKSIITTLSA